MCTPVYTPLFIHPCLYTPIYTPLFIHPCLYTPVYAPPGYTPLFMHPLFIHPLFIHPLFIPFHECLTLIKLVVNFLRSLGAFSIF
jgi:hypothetical protein